MKHLFLALLLVLCAVAAVLKWVGDQIDAHLALCAPHERFGTYVWHEHHLLGRRWLASHNTLENGTTYRDRIPWAEMRDSDIQVRVYPAGSRVP